MLRKSPSGKPRKKQVHFTFRDHPPAETYLRTAPSAKTHIIESAKGSPVEYVSKEDWEFLKTLDAREGRQRDNFQRTQDHILDKLWAKGIKVKAGETLINAAEAKKIDQLNSERIDAKILVARSRSLRNIKTYFKKCSRFDAYRHELIIRTVKSALKEGTVDLRYGSAHSVLSRELQKDGIQSSRAIGPTVFSWNMIILRKLITGSEPTDLEYKKGFCSDLHCTWNNTSTIVGKPPQQLTANDFSFFHLVQTTMLNRCTEKQINMLLKFTPIQIHIMLCILNGLPPDSTKPQFEAFLNKHSEHWRRLQRAKERNRGKQ
jgi:hypothetical protein